MATMDARAWPHIDQIISFADCFLVMLDNDDRIAKIAQTLEGCQQAVVVALVQSDGWLVQHVKDACQTRTDL